MKTCGTCGFLALRTLSETSLIEAHTGYRETREMIAIQGNRGNLYEVWPICFVHKANLKDDCGGKDDKSTVVEVLKKNRNDCDGWVEWDQGFSPKEHAEKMYNETLLKMRLEESEADRQWRERQDARDHAWRIEQAERDRDWRKEDRSLAMSNLFVAAGVGIVSAVATLVAAKLFPWFN